MARKPSGKVIKLISRENLAAHLGVSVSGISRLLDQAMAAIWQELPDEVRHAHQQPDVMIVRREEEEE